MQKRHRNWRRVAEAHKKVEDVGRTQSVESQRTKHILNASNLKTHFVFLEFPLLSIFLFIFSLFILVKISSIDIEIKQFRNL